MPTLGKNGGVIQLLSWLLQAYWSMSIRCDSDSSLVRTLCDTGRSCDPVMRFPLAPLLEAVSFGHDQEPASTNMCSRLRQFQIHHLFNRSFCHFMQAGRPEN